MTSACRIVSPLMVGPSSTSSITSLSPSRLSPSAKSSRTAPNSKLSHEPPAGRKSARFLSARFPGRKSSRFLRPAPGSTASISTPSQTLALSRVRSSGTSLTTSSNPLLFSDEPPGFERGVGRKSTSTESTTSVGRKSTSRRGTTLSDGPPGFDREVGRKSTKPESTEGSASLTSLTASGASPSSAKASMKSSRTSYNTSIPLRGTQPSTAKNESSAAVTSLSSPSSSRTIGLRREREITRYHG